jgi:hypothetical protein
LRWQPAAVGEQSCQPRGGEAIWRIVDLCCLYDVCQGSMERHGVQHGAAACCMHTCLQPTLPPQQPQPVHRAASQPAVVGPEALRMPVGTKARSKTVVSAPPHVGWYNSSQTHSSQAHTVRLPLSIWRQSLIPSCIRHTCLFINTQTAWVNLGRAVVAVPWTCRAAVS